uniref:gamma-aminobutyric acid receptor subunit rho-2-like isoform X1 n=1 Tax=Styela clava TaxID=7725 RepID=UPI00193A3951|nr:gamma-aminobutyric acid receptor subunit rho-2-like isoform X1 [Styela clava]
MTIFRKATLVWYIIILSDMSSEAKRRNRSRNDDHIAEEADLKSRSYYEPSHPTLDPHTTSMTQQVEKLFRSHAYEMSVSPSRNDEPVRVGVAILIESISDISEVNMDLTFTLRIWKSWTDERLKMTGEHESIVLPSRLIDKLWVPDLFIVGSKKSFIHRTTVDNIMLRLYKNGTISYKAKITTTVACQMNLYNFPLDIENCTLAIQSLAYTTDELELEWRMGEKMEHLFMDPKLVSNMPKFKLVHHILHTNTVRCKQGGGEVSELRVSFELQRYLLSVFFQSYFPAIIMVILAGLGMWLDPRSVPARVAMGITSVLTISTIITGLKSSLPKVSYLTAMDLYLWACFLFVFATVLEYCVLNYVMTIQVKKIRRGLKNEEMILKNGLNHHNNTYQRFTKQTSNDSVQRHRNSRTEKDKAEECSEIFSQNFSSRQPHTQYSNSIGPYEESQKDTTPKAEAVKIFNCSTKSTKRKSSRLQTHSIFNDANDATKLDVFFRIFYFLSFIIFNIAYWFYYVISTDHRNMDE